MAGDVTVADCLGLDSVKELVAHSGENQGAWRSTRLHFVVCDSVPGISRLVSPPNSGWSPLAASSMLSEYATAERTLALTALTMFYPPVLPQHTSRGFTVDICGTLPSATAGAFGGARGQ